MRQLPLLSGVTPPLHPLVDLRRCSVEEILPVEADLCIADPPWTYRQRHGTSAQDHYTGLDAGTIARHLGQIRAGRLVLWITWPVLAADWPHEIPHWGRWVSAGAWIKSDPGDAGHYGQGYHWAGCSEGVLVYARPGAYNARTALRNAWHEQPESHSRKPVVWLAQMVRRWCPPGGLVVDPYAGLGAVAEAVLLAGEGRRYLGCEIDEERHRGALALLAQVGE